MSYEDTTTLASLGHQSGRNARIYRDDQMMTTAPKIQHVTFPGARLAKFSRAWRRTVLLVDGEIYMPLSTLLRNGRVDVGVVLWHGHVYAPVSFIKSIAPGIAAQVAEIETRAHKIFAEHPA